MTIAFVSNYYNHHQKELARELYEQTDGNYTFISTSKIGEERLKLGWGEKDTPEYVKYTYTSKESLAECQKIIDEADVVLYGSAPYSLIKNRLKKGKLTFKYSERVYKKGVPYHKLPWHFAINFSKYIRYKSLYLLAASAYTAADYAKTFTFLNRVYKWGYFTELKKYENIDALIENKKCNSLLWCSRFINWKHPELPVKLAKKLRDDGYDFHLNMIGNGEMFDSIQNMIDENNLSDYVSLLGAMKPEEVRAHMEESEIFLFTSDKGEGWGAVLNECMNSTCVPVASHAIGSVPFLIDHMKNGLVYEDGNIDDLYKKVVALLDDKAFRAKLSKEAYSTMANEWNAKNAAKKLIGLSEILFKNIDKASFPYTDGVCSKASVLRDKYMN